jgi:hypothetical protein
MKRRSPPTSSKSRKATAWSYSAEFRVIANAALRRFNAERHLHPLCGAMAKSTGEPCRQIPAKGRTRCKLHGGATPRGDGPAGWHTPGFTGGLPTGKPRSDAYKAWRRREKRARVAAMTADERARYDEWQRTHKPGSVAERERARRNREAHRWLDGLMNARPRPPTPEEVELAALRAKAQAHLARLDAEISAEDATESPGGLFD